MAVRNSLISKTDISPIPRPPRENVPWLARWLPADMAARRAVLANAPDSLAAALARGANPNATHRGTPLLIQAVVRWAGDGDAVAEQLLAAGADPNARDAAGLTALSYCFDVVGQSWSLPDSSRLCSHRSPSKQGWSSFNPGTVLAIDPAEPPLKNVLAYYRVASGILESLVDAGANPVVPVAYRDTTAIALALWPDAQATADIAALHVSSLGWSSFASPSEKDLVDTAWRRALALVDLGASPNRTTPEGETMLFGAVCANRADIVLALLERGADPTWRGPRGYTPAERWPDHTEAVSVLSAWNLSQTLMKSQPPPVARPRQRM